MARYRGPKAKLCRRFGEDLFGSEKYAKVLSRKNYPPGMHGKNGMKNVGEYGKQLLMKQKIKIIYGILERQFRKHYSEVKDKPGVTGDLLLSRLERRLDNVVYRLGFASTRPQARQLVSHGMFTVNDKKVTIPSMELKVDDVVGINPHKKEKTYFKNQEQYIKNNKRVVGWLSLDNKAMTGRVSALPKREDFDTNINPQIVIEYYAK